MNERLRGVLLVVLTALLWLLSVGVAWADLIEDGISWAQ